MWGSQLYLPETSSCCSALLATPCLQKLTKNTQQVNNITEVFVIITVIEILNEKGSSSVWDLLQFILTFYTPLNFVCVPVEFTCTYIVRQKNAHLFYCRYVYKRHISYTMQHLWIIIINILFYFVPGTVFLILMFCAYIYTVYIWGKMKNVNFMTTKWMFVKYILFFFQDRLWFVQAYLFIETKNLQNAENALLDKVFIYLRTIDPFSLHQDDWT